MNPLKFHGQLREAIDRVVEAEARLREVSRGAPTTSAREAVAGAADLISSSKRSLRAEIARASEPQTGVLDPHVVQEIHDAVLIGPLAIDPVTREVSVYGEPLKLAAKEFALLRVLASEPMRVFAKEELLREVWGYKSMGSTRTLDSHASRLRRKANREGGEVFMHNVWGVGYRLCEQLPAPWDGEWMPASVEPPAKAAEPRARREPIPVAEADQEILDAIVAGNGVPAVNGASS